jgi:hypothetical protein
MVKLNRVMQLRNIDYFILKAIIQNDFKASTKEIADKLCFYFKSGFVLTESSNFTRIYLRSRLVLLEDCGFLLVVKGKPNFYILKDDFKQCIQSWVIGYMGILESGK